MISKDQKNELVKNLTQKIKSSKSVVFADFKGLGVKDITELRRELRKSGADLKVIKKTLLNVALKDSGIGLNAKTLEGQIAVAVSQTDEVAPAKIIDKFSKTRENLKLAGGVLGTKILSIEELKALAKLPGKEELLAKLVGTLNAPISGFVNVLAGNLRGLVQVLKAVSEKK